MTVIAAPCARACVRIVGPPRGIPDGVRDPEGGQRQVHPARRDGAPAEAGGDRPLARSIVVDAEPTNSTCSIAKVASVVACSTSQHRVSQLGERGVGFASRRC
jgi:hypothetical protein